MREVILYPGEDGYWVVECPSLSGCISQGKTKEEGLKNIKEAISCYIHSLEQGNLPIPEEKFEVSVVLAGFPSCQVKSVSKLWEKRDSILKGRKVVM